MFLSRRLLTLVGLAIAASGLGAWTTAATPPHIVARPTHLMVNQTVKLTGTGFPPATSLNLVECSLTHWIVPQNPCLSDNSVTVTTSSSGSFKTSMRAEICPAVSASTGTERTCYIGVPQPKGVDTVRLEGAARIVVSWP